MDATIKRVNKISFLKTILTYIYISLKFSLYKFNRWIPTHLLNTPLMYLHSRELILTKQKICNSSQQKLKKKKIVFTLLTGV